MPVSTWYDDPARGVRIASPAGSFDAYLARPAQTARPAIIVLHEVFGVNDDLRETCDEIAAEGFLAICPELFWRRQRHVDLSVQSQEDWEKGLALYTSYDIDAGVHDIDAAVGAARLLEGSSGRVGVMGFCLGGLLTFVAAARTQFDAAVAFHGARTAEFLDEAADIDAPLQMHLAEYDEFIPQIEQQQISAALVSAPNCEVFNYAGCHHAFSRHGGSHYNAAAARLARSRTIDFFRRHLA